MQKWYYILSFLFFLLACHEEKEPFYEDAEKGISIRLVPQQKFQTKIVDDDNLAEEQIINNLSIFFTEPASVTITDKYIHTGFTTSGDYKLVTLPVEPETLLTKNIYVVANYDDTATLEAITSLTNLQDLHTPEVDKTNNLNPLQGFCMFGSTLNFNFNSGSDVPATIGLERTCAKYRINLTFPVDTGYSINNSFLIQGAAKYTYVMENATAVLPQSDYFAFAAPLPLINRGQNIYTNLAYVYEAVQGPQMILYVYPVGSTEPEEFTTTLPVPVRNYLYDLFIEVYEENTIPSTRTVHEKNYAFTYSGKVYNEKGELIHEF